MWDLPRPGVEPVSLALQGRFLTTGPPGKALRFLDSSIPVLSLLPCCDWLKTNMSSVILFPMTGGVSIPLPWIQVGSMLRPIKYSQRDILGRTHTEHERSHQKCIKNFKITKAEQQTKHRVPCDCVGQKPWSWSSCQFLGPWRLATASCSCLLEHSVKPAAT